MIYEIIRNIYAEWDLPNTVLEPSSMSIVYQTVQELSPGTNGKNIWKSDYIFIIQKGSFYNPKNQLWFFFFKR